MTPSVSARWMHGKLLVAQTMAATISFQILSLDETEHAKLVEKAKIAAIVDRNSLKRSTEVADGFGAR